MSRTFTVAAVLLAQVLAATLPAEQLTPAQRSQLLRQNLQHYRETNDADGEAYTLLRLALAEMTFVNVDNVRSNLARAAILMRAGNDVFGEWLAVMNLAWVESALGRSEEAIKQVEKALALIRDASCSTAPFSAKTFLALARDLDMSRETIEYLASDADVYKPWLLQQYLQPLTDDMHGSLLTESGELERAEAALRKAAVGVQPLSGRYDYSISAHFGDLRFRQERYDEARVHYEGALNGFATKIVIPLGRPEMVEMRICDRLSRIAILTGHVEDARRWNDRALAVARSLDGQSSAGEMLPDTDAALREALKVAESMKNVSRQAAIEARLGQVQVRNRKRGEAASHYERSLQLYRSLDDPSAEIRVWGDLGVLYITAGNYEAVESVLARARERIGNKSELGNDMLASVETSLRFQQGRATSEEYRASVARYIRHAPAEQAEAARDLQRMLDYTAKVFEQGDAPPPKESTQDTTSNMVMRLADAVEQLQARNFARARETLLEALESDPGSVDRDSLQLLIGLSYFYQGDAERASRWLVEGIMAREAGIDDLRSEEMVMAYLEDQAAFYNALIESLVVSGKIAQAFDATERARARTFLRLLGNGRREPPSGHERSAVELEAEELRRKIDDWDREPLRDTTLADLRRQYQALLPRLQVFESEHVSRRAVSTQRLDAVQKELPENTTLLSYFLTQTAIHAWILDKEGVEHVRMRVNEPQLQRISCWAFALAVPRGIQMGGDGCRAYADEAYALLIEPLRSRIRNKRLMIVPHGVLHYVPFAALYDEQHKKYLVEDYTITYLPSASTIRFLREKESAVDGMALVLGDPVGADLPGAVKEARQVAEKFQTTAKLGSEAQESLLYRMNGKVDVLHIAAHGTYDAASPVFSAIHLAAGDGENGQLNVDEIQSELDLTGVNLVFLSACQSGVGKRSGGDEIVGLTRSILYAGSPGVIATLWNISDEATPLLIEAFYDHLLAGDSVADALRAAQVGMLRSRKFADPPYWAAFFLTGDPQGRWMSGRMP